MSVKDPYRARDDGKASEKSTENREEGGLRDILPSTEQRKIESARRRTTRANPRRKR